MLKNDGIVGSYDTRALATMQVLGLFNGSVLQRTDLWKETAVLGAIFWIIFGLVFAFRPEGFSQVIGSEAGIRAFLGMFAMLICFLLSFYTALTLGRWWNMRMAVGQIQDGCKDLIMMVTQLTEDQILIDAIQRYARASLYLLFAVAQFEEGQESPVKRAGTAGLLTPGEVDRLWTICPHMTFVQAETLWVWLASAVTQLDKQGLTKGPPHYCAMMKACDSGRSGISTIKTYLDTPIPLGYVHLLCFIVKLHNMILTIMLALLAVMMSGGSNGFQAVSVFRTAFKAFFMPFLYNALLILNSDCTDPFGGDPGDFNLNIYDMNMRVTAQTYAKAATNLPAWVKETTFKPIQV